MCVGQQGQTRHVYDHYSFPKGTLRYMRHGKDVLPDALYLLHFCWVLRTAELTPKKDIVEKLTQVEANLTTKCKNFIVKFCEGF
jgi:hypothetical protein